MGRFDSRTLLKALWLVASLGAARRAPAQPLPQSGEFQINAYTLLNQVTPAVAADSQGGFVVVWEQFDATPMPNDIVARRFTSAGTALGGDFQVNLFTTGVQRAPSVGRASAGGFVVVWASNAQDGDGYGVFARRYDAAGNALAAEFQVNTHTTATQANPKVAMRGAGDFVVVWQSDGQDGDGFGVFGRRFDSSGSAQGSEFLVNTYVTLNQAQSSLFMAEDASFVVSWTSDGQDGDGFGVFARHFASDGSPIGLEFQANAYTVGVQAGSAVASADDEIIVVWQSQFQDGSDFGIFGRGFDGNGVPEDGDTEDTQLNLYTNGDQVQPALRLIGAGNQTQLVVLWSSEFEDGDFYGVFGRSFDKRGLISEDEFQVNTTVPSSQRSQRVAGAGQRFVVVWQSGAQDGSGTGIFARRFVMPLTLDVDGDGDIQPLTDGMLILRYDFGFRGATLVTGAVGPGCTRCDAPSIEAYLGSV